MAEIRQTERAAKVLRETMACCKEYRHEFVMPEHLLFVLTDEFNFNRALNIFYPIDNFMERLEEKLEDIETMPDDKEYEPEVGIESLKEKCIFKYSENTLSDDPWSLAI